MLRLFSVIGLTVVAVSGISGQEMPEIETLVGCYSLELGEWGPELEEGMEAYYTPPDTLRLSEEVGDEAGALFERGKMLVRPVIDEGRTPSAYWSRDDAGAVGIVWTDGYVGVRINLAAREDGVLSGAAEAFTDNERGVSLPRTDATLRRIPCRRGVGRG